MGGLSQIDTYRKYQPPLDPFMGLIFKIDWLVLSSRAHTPYTIVCAVCPRLASLLFSLLSLYILFSQRLKRACTHCTHRGGTFAKRAKHDAKGNGWLRRQLWTNSLRCVSWCFLNEAKLQCIMHKQQSKTERIV